MTTKPNVLLLIQDIRFWIVLFFIGRLYGITNPPLEGASTWRQTDVLMIARNFFETDPNILYPRVDSAGALSGIVGVEFPVYNYLIYLISLIFGYESWYGRLINLVITSLGTLYFYKLIKNYFGESSAFYASLTLLVSMWFSYSRITIPDVFAASLCLISLYNGFRYFEDGKTKNLIVFVLLALVGCLSKISSAPILTVLAIPMFMGRMPINRKITMSLLALFIFSVVSYWYFVWVPYLNSTFGFGGYFFMGLPMDVGIQQLIVEWRDLLDQFFVTPLKYSGLVVFMVSLYLIMVRNKKWIVLIAFLLPFSFFLLFVVKSGQWYAVNDYYPLVSVPIFAFIVGIGLAQINIKALVTVLMLIIGVEGIANQIHVFKIRQPFISLLSLESTLDKFSQPDDLIAINSENSPTPMYCAHRKGWNLTNANFSDRNQIHILKTNKCKFIVILKIFNTNIDLDLPKVYDSEEYSIYSLVSKTTEM